MLLKIILVFLINVDNKFKELKKPTWRSYSDTVVLSITNRVELIDKMEFTKVVLDENSKSCIVNFAVLCTTIVIGMVIYLL